MKLSIEVHAQSHPASHEKSAEQLNIRRTIPIQSVEDVCREFLTAMDRLEKNTNYLFITMKVEEQGDEKYLSQIAPINNPSEG